MCLTAHQQGAYMPMEDDLPGFGALPGLCEGLSTTETGAEMEASNFSRMCHLTAPDINGRMEFPGSTWWHCREV